MGWVYGATPEVQAASQYRVILGVCISLTVLMVIPVCLRLFLRAHASRLRAADYVMVVSMILSIIYNALCIAQIRYGLGLPLSLRPKEDLPTYTKLNYAGRPFYQLGIAGLKASLCLSYLRLLQVVTSKKIYRALIWIVIVIATWGRGHLVGALILVFDSTPVWFPPIIMKLADHVQVQRAWSSSVRAQKAGVMCLFLLGLLTTLCSILPLTQINRVAFGDGKSAMLVLWGTIEFNVGNIVTCVPYLTPLLKGFVKDFRLMGRNEYHSHGRSYTMGDFDQRYDRRSDVSNGSGPNGEIVLGEQVHEGAEKTLAYRVTKGEMI
ncbi:uncharacterized protein N7503_001305 [Penicillium pulvis]|uniref:uncharacterized protein n=1 Tax=Penicillium pulvis TaxID=1562058 RepID=UPI002546E479|nr:uncharacterized protein N7503_001305 [Penicillium pulvis]KAJ5809087.1 hypothetical protein N7503_001305 [Penicillium pulvis]